MPKRTERGASPPWLAIFILYLMTKTQAHTHPDVRPVDLGTTLIALKFKGGVVLAADTRTSMSTYVSHRNADKIVPVSSHCLVARSGSAADTQMLAHATKQQVSDRLYRYGMSTTVSQTARYIEHLISSASNELGVSLLIAGYDKEHNSPKIYSLAASGALLEEGTFAIAGSGSTFISGYMDIHATEDLEEQAAIVLCKRAIQLAMSRDAASGGLVRIFVCDDKGIQQAEFLPAKGSGLVQQ